MDDTETPPPGYHLARRLLMDYNRSISIGTPHSSFISCFIVQMWVGWILHIHIIKMKKVMGGPLKKENRLLISINNKIQ